MSDNLVANLISAILGAAFVIIFRELFTWKEQGRIEAIRKYDLLKIDCYGRIIPIIKRIDDEKHNFDLSISEFQMLREAQSRFSHRITPKIYSYLEDIFRNSRWIQPTRQYSFECYRVDFESLDNLKKNGSHVPRLIIFCEMEVIL